MTLYSRLDRKVFKDKSSQTAEVSTNAIRAPSLNDMQLASAYLSQRSYCKRRKWLLAAVFFSNHDPIAGTQRIGHALNRQPRDACESNMEWGWASGGVRDQNLSINRPNAMNSHILSLRGGCRKANLLHQKQNTSALMMERFWVFD